LVFFCRFLTLIQIATLEASRQDTDANLKDNLERIKVPKQCLVRRSGRPTNERVLDEAEMELTAEVREFELVIQRLQEQLRKMEADLRTLRAAKFKMYALFLCCCVEFLRRGF
jgi:hypothetical protein